MTGTEKLQSVERQIATCELLGIYHLTCPYCDAENNAESEALCCELLGKAVKAILHRKELGDAIRELDALYEAASRN
jgi:hypothetical protein